MFEAYLLENKTQKTLLYHNLTSYTSCNQEYFNVNFCVLSQLGNKSKNGLKIVSSGNYGCGNSRAGDVQLKLIIQWLSASVAEIPALVYYTAGHKELSTVDTLCRIIYDRKWTVKDLAQETLKFAASIVSGKIRTDTLFSNLLGLEPT